MEVGFVACLSRTISDDKSMFGFSSKKATTSHPKREKEKPRFYLLPGQGGANYRRKQRFIIKSSLAVGAIVSLVFGLALYFMARSPR